MTTTPRLILKNETKSLSNMGFCHDETYSKTPTNITDVTLHRATGELVLEFGSQTDLNNYWDAKKADGKITASPTRNAHAGKERVERALKAAGIGYSEAESSYINPENPREPALVIARQDAAAAAKAIKAMPELNDKDYSQAKAVIHNALDKVPQALEQWEKGELAEEEKALNRDFGSKTLTVRGDIPTLTQTTAEIPSGVGSYSATASAKSFAPLGKK